MMVIRMVGMVLDLIEIIGLNIIVTVIIMLPSNYVMLGFIEMKLEQYEFKFVV